MAASFPGGLDSDQREFVKLIKANTERFRAHEVFRDFCEMVALALSNTADAGQRAARESRYADLRNRYSAAQVERFSLMLAHVVRSLDGHFHDCLGELFMGLELGDHWKGQFFTPYHLAKLMAQMTIGDLKQQLEQKRFVTLMEPACGAGGMLIATADTAMAQEVNYQQCMHATAIDVDATAVHMTYIQLSLLHYPAIVVHGNALAAEKEWSHWVTLAHTMGGWDWRLRRRGEDTPIDAGRPASVPTVEFDQVGQVRRTVIEKRIEAEQMALF